MATHSSILAWRIPWTEKSGGFSLWGCRVRHDWVANVHVWVWELDYKESWAPKNWCFWTVVLEKTLDSPLDCKEIQPVHPNGDQSWVFIGRTDVEAETPVLWPPDAKSWLIWKDPDAGNDWGQEEKGMTEDEMVGWHHQLNGHGFEWTLGIGDGQGGLACCSSWGNRESDTTEQRLNRTEPLESAIFNPVWKVFNHYFFTYSFCIHLSLLFLLLRLHWYEDHMFWLLSHRFLRTWVPPPPVFFSSLFFRFCVFYWFISKFSDCFPCCLHSATKNIQWVFKFQLLSFSVL